MPRILVGDVRERLRELPDESVHCVVTSPPYWGLRDYGVEGQLGLEPTIELYVEHMVEVFREVRRVLRKDGTLWLNMGDCYGAGKGRDDEVCRSGGKRNANSQSVLRSPSLRPKDLVGQPWRVALALQADGWYLRLDIIWNKPNPMPESCRDRPTKAHEYMFMLTRSARCFFDQEAVKEIGGGQTGSAADFRRDTPGPIPPGQQRPSRRPNRKPTVSTGTRNIRSVWTIPTQPFSWEYCTACRTLYSAREKRQLKVRVRRGVKQRQCRCGRWMAWLSHFATFPEKLVEPCIKAGTSERGACPKCGAPWVRVVKRKKGTPDPARGWDTAPGAHGREKRRGAGVPKHPRNDHSSAGGRIISGVAKARKLGGPHENPFPPRRTIGWKRTCNHRGATVSCVVLDPFGGSGTTGLVAAKLGRDYTLIELRPEYADMAEKRIARYHDGESAVPGK